MVVRAPPEPATHTGGALAVPADADEHVYVECVAASSCMEFRWVKRSLIQLVKAGYLAPAKSVPKTQTHTRAKSPINQSANSLTDSKRNRQTDKTGSQESPKHEKLKANLQSETRPSDARNALRETRTETHTHTHADTAAERERERADTHTQTQTHTHFRDTDADADADSHADKNTDKDTDKDTDRHAEAGANEHTSSSL